MKNLIIATTMLLAMPAFAKGIYGWDKSAPVSERKIIDALQSEALSFGFDGDEGSCGGEIFATSLVDSQVAKTSEGDEVHQLTVSFKVTKAVNYCASEAVLSCQVIIDVYENGIDMGEWACK